MIDKRLHPKSLDVHPWTNGHVKLMNWIIKEATAKRYYDQSHDHMKQHLQAFPMDYNFAKRLKTLKE